jgi:hypothetical protein
MFLMSIIMISSTRLTRKTSGSDEIIMLRVRDVPDTALPDAGWDHIAVCRIITRY